MPPDAATPLIAVDIGNSRIKLGLFDGIEAADRAPLPSRVLDLRIDEWDGNRVAAWLPAGPTWPEWRIGSVNRGVARRVLDWIGQERLTPAGTPPATRLLTAEDFPVAIGVEHPERVGIDRLAAAAAANRLRAPDRAALVIDIGSAITVDLVSADGVFLGGAILPGIELSARALNEYTDRLPLVTLNELTEAPAVLGASTVAAIRSGLYWGVVGAIRELTSRLTEAHSPPPERFLTGGAAGHVAQPLGLNLRYEPYLVLSGIALARW
jgi:type III pantothenate kinase